MRPFLCHLILIQVTQLQKLAKRFFIIFLHLTDRLKNALLKFLLRFVLKN